MNKPIDILATTKPQTEHVERSGKGFIATQRRGDTKYTFYGDTADEALHLLREHLKLKRNK